MLEQTLKGKVQLAALRPSETQDLGISEVSMGT